MQPPLLLLFLVFLVPTLLIERRIGGKDEGICVFVMDVTFFLIFSFIFSVLFVIDSFEDGGGGPALPRFL